MSSPKRVAKPVAKAAVKASAKVNAKTVHKTVGKAAAKAPAKPVRALAPARLAKADVKVVEGASAEAKRLAAVIERGIVDGKLDMVSTEAVQKLMAAICRVYTARIEAGEQFTPIAKNSISATDIMVTASGLLRAADLAVFELGMWQSWTGR